MLHNFLEIKIENLEKELIDDIEKDLCKWSNFTADDDPNEITKYGNKIRQKIAILKKYVK